MNLLALSYAHKQLLYGLGFICQVLWSPSPPKGAKAPHRNYEAFLTIIDPAFAASCSAFDDRCAYRMVTFGSLCPSIC